jgi:hypothetical protein
VECNQYTQNDNATYFGGSSQKAEGVSLSGVGIPGLFIILKCKLP